MACSGGAVTPLTQYDKCRVCGRELEDYEMGRIDGLCTSDDMRDFCYERAWAWVLANVPDANNAFAEDEKKFYAGPWWTVAVDAWLTAGAP